MSPAPLNKVKARLKEAEIAIEQEHFGDAVRFLREVLSMDPENSAAKELLGKAIEGQNSASAQNYLRQGRMALRQGDGRQAEREYLRALECDPSNLDARHLLAELLLSEHRDLPRALTLMKEIIALGGQRARYFATLGELLLLAKDNERAYDAYARAASMEPSNKEYAKRLRVCKK